MKIIICHTFVNVKSVQVIITTSQPKNYYSQFFFTLKFRGISPKLFVMLLSADKTLLIKALYLLRTSFERLQMLMGGGGVLTHTKIFVTAYGAQKYEVSSNI